MQCPRCNLTLQKDTEGFGIIVLDVCPRCEGCWFDKGEVDRLDKSVWANVGEIEYRRTGGDLECLACPKCRVGMVPLSPIDAKDLAVDRCPLCEGFWLDSGELEKMQDVANLPDQQGSLEDIHDQRPSNWSHLRWIIYCIKKFNLERSSLSP